MRIIRCVTGLLAISACLGGATATAEPSRADADLLFATAKRLCEADGGRLWGVTLCGPMLLVDYHDRKVIANQADAQGRLHRDGDIYRGVLPDEVIVANTPTEWAGVRWTQIVAPLPTIQRKLNVLVAHELFHRVQPSLGLSRPDIGNQHLDTLEGRYLLQLEWRALARALKVSTATDRRSAVLDALAFRHERYSLFPAAAEEERALEIAEGVPEYTGVRLGLTTDLERRDFAIENLSAFVPAPTFVRSFAYATGAAYGLLLDRYDAGWIRKLRSGGRLDELLARATGITPSRPGASDLRRRTSRYDDGGLRASELRREAARRARLADYRARLVDGPVLTLPMTEASNIQFNPQTLVPLDGLGTVYPSMRLVDEWGVLEVEEGGALVERTTGAAKVPAVGADATNLSGRGWRLVLKPDWRIVAGSRPGDLKVAKSPLRPAE